MSYGEFVVKKVLGLLFEFVVHSGDDTGFLVDAHLAFEVKVHCVTFELLFRELKDDVVFVFLDDIDDAVFGELTARPFESVLREKAPCKFLVQSCRGESILESGERDLFRGVKGYDCAERE